LNTIKKTRRMARPPYAGDTVVADTGLASGPGPAAPGEQRITKQSQVVALLHQDGGTSLAELITATSWLPHTTRAALTGLRKKGHTIVRNKVDGVTRYAISSGSAE
jgi:hypothetical protein